MWQIGTAGANSFFSNVYKSFHTNTFAEVMTSEKVKIGMKGSIKDEIKNNLSFGSYEMVYGNQMKEISKNLKNRLESIKMNAQPKIPNIE